MSENQQMNEMLDRDGPTPTRQMRYLNTSSILNYKIKVRDKERFVLLNNQAIPAFDMSSLGQLIPHALSVLNVEYINGIIRASDKSNINLSKYIDRSELLDPARHPDIAHELSQQASVLIAKPFGVKSIWGGPCGMGLLPGDHPLTPTSIDDLSGILPSTAAQFNVDALEKPKYWVKAKSEESQQARKFINPINEEELLLEPIEVPSFIMSSPFKDDSDRVAFSGALYAKYASLKLKEVFITNYGFSNTDASTCKVRENELEDLGLHIAYRSTAYSPETKYDVIDRTDHYLVEDCMRQFALRF